MKGFPKMAIFDEANRLSKRLSRTMRILLTVIPVVAIGIVVVIWGYRTGDLGKIVFASVLCFVLVPLLDIWWDFHRYPRSQ
jgi:hypothetical protein